MYNNPNPKKLRDISACGEGVAAAAKYATLREWWLKTDRRGDMMWLLGRAHDCGTLSRRSLVKVAVACAATCETPSTKPMLDALRAWVAGDDSVNLVRVHNAVPLVTSASYATRAAVAEFGSSAAVDVYDAAYTNDLTLDSVLAAIRSAISIDEIASALGMDPDHSVIDIEFPTPGTVFTPRSDQRHEAHLKVKVEVHVVDTHLGPAVHVIVQDGSRFGRRVATFFGPKRGLRRRAKQFLIETYGGKGYEVVE